MVTRRFEQVEAWDSRAVSGLAGLHDLADDGFSGAVSGDGTWAFFLNGRVVGVFDGDLEAFRSASATAYAAPEPALPLLLSMQEQGGETQAQYYSNDTPLAEVDDTLSEAGFTGYVELSENVLSGDYYLVYHGGDRLSVAFVGNREEVVAGQEAFDLAADEVGIYEVVSVDIDVADVPEPDDGGADAAAAAGAGAAAGGDGSDATDTDGADGAEDAGDAESESATPDAVAEAEPTASDDAAESDAAPESPAATATDDAPESPAAAATDDAPESPAAAATDDADAGDADAVDADRGEEPSSDPTRPADATDAGDDGTGSQTAEARAAEGASAEAASAADDDDRFSEEAAWQDTVTVPAVAPDETGTGDHDGPASGTAGGAVGGQASGVERSGDRGQAGGARRRELRSELETARDRLADLEAERDALADERDDLRQERDRLRERVEELREEVADLRSELSAAREGANDAPEGETAAAEAGGSQPAPDAAGSSGAGDADAVGDDDVAATAEGPISAGEALAGTDLFVRYGSRGEDTLDDVPDGAAPETLRSNLRLDHHTQFDDEAVTVEGRPFEDFLADTAEYGFVSWLVEEMPFEIRDTGHEAALGDLYGALPDVDRAELHGTVSVETADGETVSRDFDVVVRDRMGNALLVADLNDRRAPVSADMMDDLVGAAGDVGAAADLTGAFYVTASFFEPDALETAESATGGGFLSRDKRESYVKTGRKAGFHLCLVETRDGDFYLTVPEL